METRKRVFALFMVLLMALMVEGYADFNEMTMTYTVNGKTDLSDVSDGAFISDYYSHGAQFLMWVTNNSQQYVTASLSISDESGYILSPTWIMNDTTLGDNATVLAATGTDCSDPSYYCPASYSEVNGLSLDYDVADGIIFVGEIVIQNSTNAENHIRTWWQINSIGAGPITLNEPKNVSFDIPVFAPAKVYKNTAQNLGCVVMDFFSDTPEYVKNNVRWSELRIVFTRESDYVDVVDISSNIPSTYKTLLLENATLPVFYFTYPLANVSNESEAYFLGIERQQTIEIDYPAGGNIPINNFGLYGINSRGTFTTSEYIETTCDLENYYPSNDGCILYGLPTTSTTIIDLEGVGLQTGNFLIATTDPLATLFLGLGIGIGIVMIVCSVTYVIKKSVGRKG